MATDATKPPIFKDKAGVTINPGDLIIYGHNLGRCAGLQFGKVLGVKWSKGSYGEDPIPKITVQSANFSDNWGPGSKPTLNKPSTLSFGSRTLKIERSQVESSVLALLDTVKDGNPAPATEANED